MLSPVAPLQWPGLPRRRARRIEGDRGSLPPLPELEGAWRRRRGVFGLGVGERPGAGREPVQVSIADELTRKWISRSALGEWSDWQRLMRGREHQVAEPAALEHGRVGDQAGMAEYAPDRRYPGLGVG